MLSKDGAAPEAAARRYARAASAAPALDARPAEAKEAAFDEASRAHAFLRALLFAS